MTVTPVIKLSETAIRRRAPRLAGDARRAQIIEAACRFFSDNGFSGPTRDLAASIGVTQALLYRYFDSKTDLIDSVFAEIFDGDWEIDALARFEAGAGRPVVERLVEAYEATLPRMTDMATRLLFLAGLESYAGPIYRDATMGWALCCAMIEAWRRDEGLPPLAVRPLLEGERSLACALHTSMFMIRVREHVLRVPRALSDADEIRQVAETHDAGIRAVMRKLHAGDASVRRTAPVAEEALEAA